MTELGMLKPKYLSVNVSLERTNIDNTPQPERTLVNCWRLLRGRPLKMQVPPVYTMLESKLANAYLTYGAANEIRTFLGEPLLPEPVIPLMIRLRRFVRWQLFGWWNTGPRKL